MIIENLKISAREIEEKIYCSASTARKIRSEDLGMVKMNCRWLPKILSNDEKEKRVNVCQSNLRLYESNWYEFLRTLIICDETLVKLSTPEIRTSGAEWRERGHLFGTKSPQIGSQ